LVELPQQNIPTSQDITGDIETTSLSSKRLYGPAQPVDLGSPPISPAPDDLLYTCPANTLAVVKQIILVNTLALASPPVPAKISMSIGPFDAATAILWDYELDAGETKLLDIIVPLTASETIHAVQETSGAITVTISGTEQAV